MTSTQVVAPALVRDAQPRRRLPVPHKRAIAFFVLPFGVLFALFYALPVGYAVWQSLLVVEREGTFGPARQVFGGLAQYEQVFQNGPFWASVGRVLVFGAVQVPVMLLLALVFALALDSGLLRLARVVRLGIFVPYAVPSVVATLMWGYLYGPDYGPFAQLARGLDLPVPPFLSEGWMLGSLANVVTWEFVGYNMIILYAALRAIPQELYEAAAVDGAGAWRIAWSVKLPALRPALLLTLVFSVIGSFQLFNEPKLLQSIAPAVIDSGYTANLYAYSLAFISQQANYAAAVSFLLGAVIVVVSYAVLLTANRGRTS